jgi:hypothetical protein
LVDRIVKPLVRPDYAYQLHYVVALGLLKFTKTVRARVQNRAIAPTLNVAIERSGIIIARLEPLPRKFQRTTRIALPKCVDLA